MQAVFDFCCLKMNQSISANELIDSQQDYTIGVQLQCPLDIQTLDKAAALPIAAATRVTDLRQYINSNLAYSNLKFLVLCTN